MDDEERAWILESQNGDCKAFESLIRNYQRMIHALTFRMTGSMVDAEDLAQETFIQAHQQISNFRGESAFSSWLYRIAINRCLNWRKRQARRDRLHAEWVQVASDAAPDGDSRTHAVQQALMKLEAKQRAAVILTIYDGHNHAEAARILGCSETTVSWRLFAARRKLKRWLTTGKAGDEEV
jgi:RNA polymerase sigma-70 factor, ECF subfamily